MRALSNYLKTNINLFLSSSLNFLYPPLCLHCRAIRENNLKLFCQACQDLFQLFDLENRCYYCFVEVELIRKPLVCSSCLKRRPSYISAAAYPYEGPAASLIRQLKYGNQPYLVKAAGACLSAQFLRLNWPMPDLLVPVPISSMRLMTRGYNQSLLLAKQMGDLLSLPVEEVLKRKNGGYSQAGLSQKKRVLLDGNFFLLREESDVQGKKLLLIDDVATTGTTLNRCVEVLLEGFPLEIFVLTFCKTE